MVVRNIRPAKYIVVRTPPFKFNLVFTQHKKSAFGLRGFDPDADSRGPKDTAVDNADDVLGDNVLVYLEIELDDGSKLPLKKLLDRHFRELPLYPIRDLLPELPLPCCAPVGEDVPPKVLREGEVKAEGVVGESQFDGPLVKADLPFSECGLAEVKSAPAALPLQTIELTGILEVVIEGLSIEAQEFDSLSFRQYPVCWRQCRAPFLGRFFDDMTGLVKSQ